MELDSLALPNALQSLASHALPAFGMALASIIAAVCALWWLVQRYGVHRETSRLTPLAYLLGYLAVGLALIFGAAALFAEIAENLGDGRALGAPEQLFSDTVQATLSPATDVLAGMASGSAWLTVCIGAVELVRYRQQGWARTTA